VKAQRIALKILYWLAVLLVSLVLVFLLILLFESLDDAGVEQGGTILMSLRHKSPCPAYAPGRCHSPPAAPGLRRRLGRR
jgi:hypothetical protein